MSRRTRPLLSTARCPRAYGPNELRALVSRLKTVSISAPRSSNGVTTTILGLDGDDALVTSILDFTPSYMKPPLTMVCTRLGALCKASPARSNSRRGGAQMQLWMANATASDGQLDLLIWLINEGFEWDPVECATTAARNGHLHVLEWIVTTPANYMSINPVECANTTAKKSPEELSLTLEQFYAAVEGGHLKVVEWFLTASPKVSYDVSTALAFAVKGGDHLVDDETQSTGLVAKIAPNYKFQEIDSSVDVKLTAAAVSSGNEHVLTLLFNKYSAEETPEHVLLTIMSGSIEMAEDAVFQAARSGHGSILQKCNVLARNTLRRAALLGATMRGDVGFLSSTSGQERLTTDNDDWILFCKLAIRSGNLKMVEFMFNLFNGSLNRVARSFGKLYWKEELLCEAVATNDICIFKFIWGKFENRINILKIASTMYEIAVMHGNIQMIDPTIMYSNSKAIILNLAIASGDLPTVQTLIGDFDNVTVDVLCNAAKYAALYGRLNVLTSIQASLISRRVVWVQTTELAAAAGGWLSVLRWLISKRPQTVNIPNNHEYKLCLNAAKHGAFDCFIFMFNRLTADDASKLKGKLLTDDDFNMALLNIQYASFESSRVFTNISIQYDVLQQHVLDIVPEHIKSLRKISWRRLKIWMERTKPQNSHFPPVPKAGGDKHVSNRTRSKTR